MEYRAIFEINSGMKYDDGIVYPIIDYKNHRFSTSSERSAMDIARNIAKHYALTSPINPLTRNNIVKIIDIHSSAGSIDQKNSGISGYFEKGCLTVKYSNIEMFFHARRN